MPASPLTIAGRQVAARMSAQEFPALEGNMQILRMMQNEDAATVGLLHDEMAASPSPPGGTAYMLTVQAQLKTIAQWSGNIGVWPQLFANSGAVWNACDYLDALPAPPVLLGTIIAAQVNPAPLVMLTEAGRPLNALAVDGSSVKVEGSQWLSINDQTFTITVADRPLAQFILVEADTTDEISANVGGTVWFLPP